MEIRGDSLYHEYAIVCGEVVKVTGWFAHNVVPTFPGNYQRLFLKNSDRNLIVMHTWDGLRWKTSNGRFTNLVAEWRGVIPQEGVRPPKGALEYSDRNSTEGEKS